MLGTEILVRTLSRPTRTDSHGNIWQYHSRSDHHSKVACWGILFDLIRSCAPLRAQIAAGRVAFGINHEMRDFARDRKKNLDLVLCTPGHGKPNDVVVSFADMAEAYQIELTSEERAILNALPSLRRAPVGSVLLALEAKACMTAHQRALPRLYDELNSSHQAVHGASDQAIAGGFVMVNAADRYVSPDLNRGPDVAKRRVWSSHKQPRDARLVVDKVRQLPRRARPGETGYDALAIVVIDCRNDESPVKLFGDEPAVPLGDIHQYASMIERMAHIWATRFAAI